MEGSPDSPDLDACIPAPFRRDSVRCYLPCRYALTILSGSGFCVLLMIRVNLSVAIVAMVNSTYADAKASANNPECQRDKVKTASVKGVAFPAMHAMWSSWAPPLERSKLCILSYSGLNMGTILGMPLAGLLCASDIWGGWPSAFYIFGAVGIVWTIMWMTLTYDKPANHPRISIREKEYIQSSIGSGQDVRIRKYNTPWLKILTSPAVWAIIIANFCDNWGFFTFVSCLPSYFKEVLNFSISENGFLSAVPFMLCYIFGVGGSFVADWLRYRRILRTGEVRKVFSTAGFLVPACLLVSTSYVGCDYTGLAVSLFSLAIGIQGLVGSSYTVNHLDIAPRFAGILMGISNSVGTIPGMIAPYIVGLLTDNQPTRTQWQKVFYLSAGVYVFGWMVYLLLGSGREQSWNTPYETLLVPGNIPWEHKPVMPNVVSINSTVNDHIDSSHSG